MIFFKNNSKPTPLKAVNTKNFTPALYIYNFKFFKIL